MLPNTPYPVVGDVDACGIGADDPNPLNEEELNMLLPNPVAVGGAGPPTPAALVVAAPNKLPLPGVRADVSTVIDHEYNVFGQVRRKVQTDSYLQIQKVY